MWTVHSKALILIFSNLFVTINCGFWSKTNKEPPQTEVALTNETLPVADIFLNRIRDAGYPAELHTVQTDDGYILKMLRIPYSEKTKNNPGKRKPVFVMHSFLESSHAWIVQGPGKALAYLLADAGYDVWLGNARGTEMSNEHAWLNSSDDKYWDFSWQKIGEKDLPAFIDYVLAHTDSEKLNYVGFSQGSTTFLVMASTQPVYNYKIHQASLMAPAAFLVDSGKKTLSQYYWHLNVICEKMGFTKLTNSNFKIFKREVENCRNKGAWATKRCEFFTNFFGLERASPEIRPLIMQHIPAGVSINQYKHFAQLIRSGEFLQYDYDDKYQNWLHYGDISPPSFKLSQVTVDINLYLSKDDKTTTMTGIMKLTDLLPNVRETHVVSGFKHSDFIYNAMAADLVYEKLISEMRQSD